MSYIAHVRFDREAGDDAEIVEGKVEYFGLTYREAFKRQLAAELQTAYDDSEGGLAGHFEIIAVDSPSAKVEKFLSTKVGDDAEPMKRALMAIAHARDYNAEHGRYPEGTLREDQSFDDWAAEIAEDALRRGK